MTGAVDGLDGEMTACKIAEACRLVTGHCTADLYHHQQEKNDINLIRRLLHISSTSTTKTKAHSKARQGKARQSQSAIVQPQTEQSESPARITVTPSYHQHSLARELGIEDADRP